MVVGARGLVRTVARVLGVRDDFVGVRGELQAAAARDGSAGASSRLTQLKVVVVRWGLSSERSRWPWFGGGRSRWLWLGGDA